MNNEVKCDYSGFPLALFKRDGVSQWHFGKGTVFLHCAGGRAAVKGIVDFFNCYLL